MVSSSKLTTHIHVYTISNCPSLLSTPRLPTTPIHLNSQVSHNAQHPRTTKDTTFSCTVSRRKRTIYQTAARLFRLLRAKAPRIQEGFPGGSHLGTSKLNKSISPPFGPKFWQSPGLGHQRNLYTAFSLGNINQTPTESLPYLRFQCLVFPEQLSACTG